MQLTQASFQNRIVTDAFTGLAKTWIAAPPSVAQYAPGHLSPGGGVARWATERGRRTRAKTRKSMRVNSQGETELARNQIASSNVASSKGGIIERHTKDKNRQATVARCSKRMPAFIALVSESLQNILQLPLTFSTRALSETIHEFRKQRRATSQKSN